MDFAGNSRLDENFFCIQLSQTHISVLIIETEKGLTITNSNAPVKSIRYKHFQINALLKCIQICADNYRWDDNYSIRIMDFTQEFNYRQLVGPSCIEVLFLRYPKPCTSVLSDLHCLVDEKMFYPA